MDLELGFMNKAGEMYCSLKDGCKVLIKKTQEYINQNVGLGAGRVKLSNKHPFHYASIFHDATYEFRDSGKLLDPEYKKLTLSLIHI